MVEPQRLHDGGVSAPLGLTVAMPMSQHISDPSTTFDY